MSSAPLSARSAGAPAGDRRAGARAHRSRPAAALSARVARHVRGARVDRAQARHDGAGVADPRAGECAGVPVVPQAGNTGLVGGQIPTQGEILLSVGRLKRVRAVDAAGYTMTVEAGLTLAEAQAAADKVDRLFPLSLPSEGSCQIGGNTRHQRRRRRRAGLRQRAPASARARGGAGRRARLGRPQGPQEGQHRLRPQGPVHRLGGHARRHHCRRAQAVSQAGREGHRIRRAAGPRRGAAAVRPGAGDRRPWPHRLRGHGRHRAGSGAEACAGHARPVPGRGIPGTRCWRLRPQGRRHGRAAADRGAGKPRPSAVSSPTPPSPARSPRRTISGACASPIRRRRNPRAATSRTTSPCRSPASPSSSPAPTPPSSGSAPARGRCRSATSATATCTTTSPSPSGMTKQAFLARWDDITRAVHDIVVEHRRLDLGRARHRPA